MAKFCLKGLPFHNVVQTQRIVIVVLTVLCLYLLWTRVTWGEMFPYPSTTKNIKLDCLSPDGAPMCCALVTGPYYTAEHVRQYKEVKQSRYTHMAVRGNQHHIRHCHTVRSYEPSPYELRHFQFAEELETIKNEYDRRNKLISFIKQDIPDANRWLERVRVRMQADEADAYLEATDHDWHYLSRFKITRTCRQNIRTHGDMNGAEYSNTTDILYEWIEPITVHMRHPFAFVQCFTGWMPEPYWPSQFRKSAKYMAFEGGIVLTDYILLKTNAHDQLTERHSNKDYLHNRYTKEDNVSNLVPNSTENQLVRSLSSTDTDHVSSSGNSIGYSAHETQETAASLIVQKMNDQKPIKHYLFDAGTSTFDSSLFWFLCGYHQLGIEFDKIYGWEYTLLEPQAFWNKVPISLIANYHFYNTPVSADPENKHSLTRMIKQVASAQDFVSVKLDIDTPEVEIPIVLQLLQDDSVSSLVDEFFFELHFRCEFLMYCGWGTDIPKSMLGLKLNRPSAMSVFQRLRFKGIRAHVWP